MARFRVHLVATTEVTASCDIEVEAETEEEANDKALEVYDALEAKQEEALKRFRAGTGKHPGYTINWDVDSSDVDPDRGDIEVDTVEEIEA